MNQTETSGRDDGSHCFACGQSNPVGLKIQFRLDNGVCRGELTPGVHHVGYDGLTHGGILFCALDDVMANWFFLQGARGYTGRSEVRFREPVQVGTTILLEGSFVKKKGKLVLMQAIAHRADNRQVVAEAQASYLIVDPGPWVAPKQGLDV